jgi:L-2-hydroxyglutarate oxidase LhgO
LNIAQEHGIGHEYDFFPIKGLYSLSEKRLDHIYKTLVYPVPIKRAYFLGVHSTLTVNGYMKIGPTVAPAFSLENYHGLENINIAEALRISANYAKMLFSSD